MNRIITPGTRGGEVTIPSSKSQMHRLLICAALGTENVTISCAGLSKDIRATADCLNALGAHITEVDAHTLYVEPIREVPEGLCELHCGESGSTLRFLLPVVGMLGAKTAFVREGRLPERPLAPLDAVLCTHGMTLRSEGALLYTEGTLCAGAYEIPGDISSQYISGLLMTLPGIAGDSTLTVTGKIESAAYITMTEDALKLSGIRIEKDGYVYTIPGGQKAGIPGELRGEGDYSNAAFFLSMGAMSEKGLLVKGLNRDSSQGDKAVVEILRAFGAEITEQEDGYFVKKKELRPITIDAAPIPDLIPVLSVVAAAAEGDTHVINAGRLRLKESDRIETTAALLRALGGEVTTESESMIIHGKGCLTGGTVDSAGDHRIAMSAATAAGIASGEILIEGSECVAKSYPDFYKHLDALTV